MTTLATHYWFKCTWTGSYVVFIHSAKAFKPVQLHLNRKYRLFLNRTIIFDQAIMSCTTNNRMSLKSETRTNKFILVWKASMKLGMDVLNLKMATTVFFVYWHGFMDFGKFWTMLEQQSYNPQSPQFRNVVGFNPGFVLNQMRTSSTAMNILDMFFHVWESRKGFWAYITFIGFPAWKKYPIHC